MTAKDIDLLGVAVPLDPTRVSLFAAPPVVATPQCATGYCYVVNDARWDYATPDHRAVLQKTADVAASCRLEPAFGKLAVGPGKLVVLAAPDAPLSEDVFAYVRSLFGEAPPRTADGFALAVCDWEKWLELRRQVAEQVVGKLDAALGADDMAETSRLQKLYEGIEGAPLDSVRIRRLILLKREKATDKYARRLFSTARLLKISEEELERRILATDRFIIEKFNFPIFKKDTPSTDKADIDLLSGVPVGALSDIIWGSGPQAAIFLRSGDKFTKLMPGETAVLTLASAENSQSESDTVWFGASTVTLGGFSIDTTSTQTTPSEDSESDTVWFGASTVTLGGFSIETTSTQTTPNEDKDENSPSFEARNVVVSVSSGGAPVPFPLLKGASHRPKSR